MILTTFTSTTTHILLYLFVLLTTITITTAIPPPQLSSSSLTSASTSAVSNSEANILREGLRRDNHNRIVKRASTGEIIGIVIGSVAVVILLGLFCYISILW
jgi:hypothetical protein